MKSLSRIQLFVTPWTVACQDPPSIGFSRSEYRSALPFPSPGDLPNPEIEPGSPVLQADSLLSEPPRKSNSIVPSYFQKFNTHDFILSHRYPFTPPMQWHPTPVLLPRKSHGRRSLVGCSPWGREELETTEQLPFHFSLSCIGEGSGNPLHCSCLENPRDREA